MTEQEKQESIEWLRTVHAPLDYKGLLHRMDLAQSIARRYGPPGSIARVIRAAGSVERSWSLKRYDLPRVREGVWAAVRPILIEIVEAYTPAAAGTVPVPGYCVDAP